MCWLAPVGSQAYRLDRVNMLSGDFDRSCICWACYQCRRARFISCRLGTGNVIQEEKKAKWGVEQLQTWFQERLVHTQANKLIYTHTWHSHTHATAYTHVHTQTSTGRQKFVQAHSRTCSNAYINTHEVTHAHIYTYTYSKKSNFFLSDFRQVLLCSSDYF